MHPDEKSQKRVEKLFSDLEQIATHREPLTDWRECRRRKRLISARYE